MDNPSVRRFQVLDAMVLAAATAVGLGVGETVIRTNGEPASWEEIRWALATLDETPSWAIRGVLTHVVTRVGCLVMFWTVALIILRFRSPRPTLRELGARPGFAACLAVMLNGLFLGTIAWGDGRFPPPGWPAAIELSRACAACISDVVVEPIRYAPVVAIVWIVLALSGAWTSEANWIDRAGRALGWFVIGSALALKVLLWTFF